jgi:hypothetical protein
MSPWNLELGKFFHAYVAQLPVAETVTPSSCVCAKSCRSALTSSATHILRVNSSFCHAASLLRSQNEEHSYHSTQRQVRSKPSHRQDT